VTHAELLAAIQLQFSTRDTRLFRMNAGIAWQGDIASQNDRSLLLRNPRAVRLGPEGISDLVGFTGPQARFVAIECKTGSGRLSKQQRAFLELVHTMGALAGVARSIEEAGLILADCATL
jgi:hypothetical protein